MHDSGLRLLEMKFQTLSTRPTKGEKACFRD